ncbi:MAG: helix-turn-helix transcriptional regulator [Bacteroidaceae bacterium]|nr:helix-turn-helix transcriptional regulator [Bacteroidaceae bacterium]
MKREEGTWELVQQLIAAIPAEQKKQFDYSNDISDRLDAIMKERGISQRELARMTGKRPSEVTRWLSGQHNFTLATIAKLSVALNHDFVSIT